MCGIVGMITDHNIKDYLINGLEKLEYRGYDSCGITLLYNKKLSTKKSLKRIKPLKRKLRIDSNIGIAHTRWATHGKVNKTNAHPIFSFNKNFVIVHNGIIENYIDLKNKYLKDYSFKTETDTEVIINLIDYLSKKYNILDSIKILLTLLKGTFACLVINKNENKIYFFKHKSPLIIGKGDGIFFTSDMINLPNCISKYYRLNDGDYGYADLNNVYLYNSIDSNFIFQNIPVEKNDLLLNSYNHYMEKEIYETPCILKQIHNIDLSVISNTIKKFNRVCFIASGTSFHAAEIGSYFLHKIAHVDSMCYVSSEFSIDDVRDKKTLFFVISQSGETADLISVINTLKKNNFTVFSLTNSLYSTIATLSDININMNAGPEIAVASTKSYTMSIAILYKLANQLIDKEVDFAIIENDIKNILSRKNEIYRISKQISKKKDLFFLGKRLDFLLCKEASLKLKEISYIHCEAFQAGELKHGSIALINNKTILIYILTEKDTEKLIRHSINEVKSRGATVITICTESLSTIEDTFIIHDSETAFIQIALLSQLIAYYTASILKKDIDKPRNLAKSVTVE